MSEQTTSTPSNTPVINENTSEAPQVMEVSAGNGSISFDELESALAVKPEGSKAVDTAETKKGKEIKSESKTKGKEEDSKEEEVTKEVKKDVATDKDKTATKVRTYKVKAGDTELDLSGDGLLEVVVDGKKQTATVQDLLNNYSGKTSWDRKFSELDVERKTYQKDRDTLQKTLDHFYELASTHKKPYEAINFLGEILGADMGGFWDTFEKEMIPKVEELAKLTPEEREARSLKAKLERYEQRDAAYKEREVSQKVAAEMQTRVKSLQEKHKIDDQSFYKAFQELSKSGEVEEGAITPELVAEFYVEHQARSQLQSLVSELQPDAEPEQQSKIVDQIKAVAKANPDMSFEDLRDIAVEVYGNKAAKNLSRKLSRSKPVSTSKTPLKSGEDAWSFDQIE